MLTLFHHPFCPHSRFVRLALGEYGIAARTVEERVWERRQEFLILNPACTTPVVVEEGRPAIPGAAIIAEYLDETRGGELGELRLLPREPSSRVEVRRLMSWFNDKFFAEVSGPLTTERLYKRQMPTSAGGGSPDTEVIRAARHNMRYHLAYIGWLVRTRDWLAGGRMSYADLAAAAHLSAADYLGDVPWNEDEAAKSWYAQIKSRPSFRPILAETLAGIPPSETYADLDFEQIQQRSKRRGWVPHANTAATPSASRGRIRSRRRPSGCGISSPKAPTATWIGWKRPPGGASARARSGRRCAPSSCSGSTTAMGPTAIRWRSCGSATAARSRFTHAATTTTTSSSPASRHWPAG